MSGIFGVVSKEDCVRDLFYGTFYLQHRAQDYCGLALAGDEIHTHKGLVRQQFPKDKLQRLEGTMGVGCVSSDRQPISELSRSGNLITCLDGNVINYEEIRDDLLREKVTFSGYNNLEGVNDSMLVSKIISRALNFDEGIAELVRIMGGDFAIISLGKEGIYAARGWGRKPLIIGKKDGSHAVSSESNSFINTGFSIVRDVEPGEIVLLNGDGITSIKKLDLSPIKYGTFEWVYTAYPPSEIDGRSVAEVREKIGQLLAKRYPVEVDIVSPIPNSGRWHAIGYAKGYARESGAYYAEAFARYDYSDRSFTPAEQIDRDEEARTKLIPIGYVIKGNRIVIVDDSIVRGTQTLNKVRILRELGAKEVHARIACPPLMHACMYGKTTKNDEDCIARRMSLKDIQQKLELDSLGYATVEDLESAIGLPRDKLCLECWDQ